MTLSWNSSSALSTGRGYILQVTGKDAEMSPPPPSRQFEDIDVGLKMNSYTVNGLKPGQTYVFELCLRKESYVITISSTVLTTKYSGFEVELGIETDYVSLFSVAIVLTSMVTVCFTVSLFRVWQYYYFYYSGHGSRGRKGDPDCMSQREMIVSPSEHSSVTCPPGIAAAAAAAIPSSASAAGISTRTAAAAAETESGLNFSSAGDESRLVEHEVASPVDEVVRETAA